MGKTDMTITNTERMAAALRSIAERMAAASDRDHAGKLEELLDKLDEGKAVIACCGHFSAGKSTLVNRLCGAPLLPSSPIPTSANVVSIKDGEPLARIVRRAGGKMERLAVPPEALEQYCVNGEEFVTVDITYPIPLLGQSLMLLDTPGIDSTDDAHRMATESALHMADVVFYVMDYNHVQSEINFTFAKQLADWGKPMVLIVNQIDKHRDRELSFDAYRDSVAQAFADWHLEPAAILYVTMKQPDHPRQQWDELLRLIGGIGALKSELAAYSVDASARHLIAEHGKRLEAADEQERAALLEQVGGEAAAAAVRSEHAAVQSRLAELADHAEQLRIELQRSVQQLLDNAIITPAATRDYAHAMLESRKPGFKMGLLFAGAKTEAERERRLAQLAGDINAQAKAGIEWHLKDMLRAAAERIGWRGEEAEQAVVEPLACETTPERLLALIQPGAVFGNEYTMTYSNALAADVKSAYKKRALDAIDRLVARAAEASRAAAAEAKSRLAATGAQTAALDRLDALEAARTAALQALSALLPPRPAKPQLPAVGAAGAANDAPTAGSGETAAAAAAAPARKAASDRLDGGTGAAARRSGSGLAAGDALAPQRRAAAKLRQAAALLAPHAPLVAAAEAMAAKADRLEHGRFTIALFGAFSAGKSSFANALIGDAVLPVSPNPTTAAINRIVPPTAERPHGAARVIMKRHETMLDDVRHSLTMLGEHAEGDDIGRLLEAVRPLSPSKLHPGGRPHYSFLKSALAGWETYGKLLGQEIWTDGDEYRRYVAEESRSCFVQEIELHVDCPLTAQGVVLVDTPGADSVNARHTDVAFHYIKNADAILFVTYYNHAFSQADRQFLLQLGRVKEQFELDKMFFIVNAADLASSEEELQGVIAHVEQNLLQHGIRFPRTHPVSSLMALDAKLADDEAGMQASGIAGFEQAFASFASDDLGGMAVQSAEREIERASGIVAGWIEAAGKDAASRKQELETLRAKTGAAADSAEAIFKGASSGALGEELAELLHHVLQRVRYRFGDHYNLAFHPSALQDDGRDLRKMIWTCWLELQQLLRQELTQELQATSLRMDNKLAKLAGQLYETAADSCKGELDGFAPATLDPQVPDPPGTGPGWETDVIDAKWLWGKFKSPRSFFEGEGKAALRSELDNLLTPEMNRFMADMRAGWEAAYAANWEAVVLQAEQQLKSELRDYASGREASLSDAVKPETLRELHTQLAAIG